MDLRTYADCFWQMEEATVIKKKETVMCGIPLFYIQDLAQSYGIQRKDF